jgi:uncharacterized protein (DUF608 family)
MVPAATELRCVAFLDDCMCLKNGRMAPLQMSDVTRISGMHVLNASAHRAGSEPVAQMAAELDQNHAPDAAIKVTTPRVRL